MLSATSGGSGVANDSKQLTTGTLPETQTCQCREKNNNKGEPKTQDCLNARLSKGVHGETIALALPCVAGESSSSMPSLVTRIYSGHQRLRMASRIWSRCAVASVSSM